MKNRETKNLSDVLRCLPSIDAVLQTATSRDLIDKIGEKRLTELARRVTGNLRWELQNEIGKGENSEREKYTKDSLLEEVENRLKNVWRREQKTALQRVINAAGVIIHTNLGRSSLSAAAQKALLEASGYCNLEYDIETGKRGKRGARAENLLAELTGAEAALIVNNCAAACVLVLTSLCSGFEAVVSRGELVEIGGDFRVPEVMTQAGAKLVEVGTTNKTRVADYQKAITENTRLLVKVHPSNYRIIGFTATPDVKELAEIAEQNDVLLYEDAGSGALLDMSRYGLTDEPVIKDSIKAGADIVTFSGDKLLGGIQSGLIVGRRELIEKLRRNPLYRALRVSKLVYAVLEKTLAEFRREEIALKEIPTLKMIAVSSVELKERTEDFARKLRAKLNGNSTLKIKLTEGKSVIGGGSAPAVQPVTTLLVLDHEKLSAAKLEKKLRHSEPPVITRIIDEKVSLDLRTVAEEEMEELLEILSGLAKE